MNVFTFSKRFENVSEIPCERKRFLKRFKLKRFIRNVLENALRVNAALNEKIIGKNYQ